MSHNKHYLGRGATERYENDAELHLSLVPEWQSRDEDNPSQHSLIQNCNRSQRPAYGGLKGALVQVWQCMAQSQDGRQLQWALQTLHGNKR